LNKSQINLTLNRIIIQKETNKKSQQPTSQAATIVPIWSVRCTRGPVVATHKKKKNYYSAI